MKSALKILIVDDHQMVLDGLRLMLGDQFNIIGAASNGKEALDYTLNNEVDVILMDLNMPVMNGIDASKKILIEKPDTKILILSMLSDKKLIQKLVKEGIKGYMLKNSGQDEIIEAISKVSNGELYFDQPTMKLMMSGSDASKAKSESIFPSLSRREKEILALIISELTSSEIAEKLFIGLGTVESHRRNMIRKLGVRNTAGLVVAAYEYDLLSE